MKLKIPHTTCCMQEHLYKCDYTLHTVWAKKETFCRTETGSPVTEPWGWGAGGQLLPQEFPLHFTNLCLQQWRSATVAVFFLSLTSETVHVHLHLCCCQCFCSPVTPPSCLHCRGSSLCELLPVQKVCPPITGSGPAAAYNSSVQTLFSSCSHCPTYLVPQAVLPDVLSLGNTLHFVNQSWWRCHRARFQRCGTEIHRDSLWH